jgi:ADP-ribosylation factor-binding protein GGA
MYPPPPMAKILELIHEWKNTLCVSSKYRDDLIHIRDMHRLLGYKGARSFWVYLEGLRRRFLGQGYRFPAFDKRAVSVLNPADVSYNTLSSIGMAYS